MAPSDAWLDIGNWIRIARSNRAASLVVLGLVLGVFALFGPWFSIDVFQNGQHQPVVDLTTTSQVIHYTEGTYAVQPYDASSCRCATTAGTFNLVLASVGLAVIVGAATAVAFLQGWVNHDLRLALAALCGVLLILGPVLMAINLPGALAADDQNLAPGYGGWDEDNWQRSIMGQNTSQTTVKVSWGPSWAWVLSLAGGIAILLGVVISRRGNQQGIRPATAVAAPATPPPAAQAPAAAPPPPASPPPAAPPSAPSTPSSGGDGDPTAGGAFPAPSVGGDQKSSGGQ